MGLSKTRCEKQNAVDVERIVAFYFFLLWNGSWITGWHLRSRRIAIWWLLYLWGEKTLDKSILCWNGKQNWVHLYTSPEWLLLVMLWPCSGIFRIWLLPWFIWNGSVVLLVDTFEQISHLTSVLLPILIYYFLKGEGIAMEEGHSKVLHKKTPPPPPSPPCTWDSETCCTNTRTHTHIMKMISCPWCDLVSHLFPCLILKEERPVVQAWLRCGKAWRGGLFRSLAQGMFFAVVAVAQMFFQAYLCVCVCVCLSVIN